MQSLPDLTRTKLCKTLIASGECLNPRCTYAHRAAELRDVEIDYAPTTSADHAAAQQPSRRAGRETGLRVPAVLAARAERALFVEPLDPVAAEFGHHWPGFAPQMTGPEDAFAQLDGYGVFGSSYPSASGFEESAAYLPPAAVDFGGPYLEAGFDEVSAASSSGAWWQTGFGEHYAGHYGEQYGELYGVGHEDSWQMWPGYGCAEPAPLEQDDCWASSVGDVSTCDPEDGHRMDDTDFRRRPIRLVRSADGALCTLGCDGLEAITS